MDSEQFFARQGYDSMDVAAVWPTWASLAPFPIPELEPVSHQPTFRATPAAQDVPTAVDGLIAAFFAVPRIFFAVERDSGGRARLLAAREGALVGSPSK